MLNLNRMLLLPVLTLPLIACSDKPNHPDFTLEVNGVSYTASANKNGATVCVTQQTDCEEIKGTLTDSGAHFEFDSYREAASLNTFLHEYYTYRGLQCSLDFICDVSEQCEVHFSCE